MTRSRNEALASLMRRVRICEERGSGIDKVISQVETLQLPAPLFEQPQGFTRVVLFAHKPLTAMDNADRVRDCSMKPLMPERSRWRTPLWVPEFVGTFRFGRLPRGRLEIA